MLLFLLLGCRLLSIGFLGWSIRLFRCRLLGILFRLWGGFLFLITAFGLLFGRIISLLFLAIVLLFFLFVFSVAMAFELSQVETIIAKISPVVVEIDLGLGKLKITGLEGLCLFIEDS